MLIAKLVGYIVITAMFMWIAVKIYRDPTANEEYKGSKQAKVAGTILAVVGLTIWGVAMQTMMSATDLIDVAGTMFLTAVIVGVGWLRYSYP